MEAKAKYDYNAGDQDELSFRRGTTLKILDKESDPHWYTAELNGAQGLVPSNYVEMENCSWYLGKISRLDSDKTLNTKHEGAFLVRRAQNGQLGEFSLSVKIGNGVEHFKILRDTNKKFYLWVVKFDSLNELVEHHRTNTVSRYGDVKLRDMEETGKLYEALYDFHAQDSDELSFRKGDVILITDDSDEHWWDGEINDARGKREGKVPAIYVTPKN